MANTKMTKKEMYVVVRGIIEGSHHEMTDEIVNFINHEIELLNRKSSSSTMTKTQKENIAICGLIKEALAALGRPVTVTELMSVETLASYNSQKLSALLAKMGEKGTKEVVRTVEKKKAYFTLA